MQAPPGPHGTAALQAMRSDVIAKADEMKVWRLFAVSALSLLMELAMIRFVNSTVQVVSYFNNFLILSAFLGLGVGSLMRKRPRSALIFPLVCALAIGICVVVDTYGFRYESRDLVLWHFTSSSRLLPVPLVIAGVFGINTLLFVPLGNQLGYWLEEVPGALIAYGFDIAGSFIGVVLFAILSALGTPPWVWFSIAAIITVFIVWPKGLGWALTALAAFAVAIGLSLVPARGVWSPYYKVQLTPMGTTDAASFLGYAVLVDKVRIQDALRFSEALMRSPLAPWVDYYRLPYSFSRPKTVLILGGGCGNDVTIALATGAEQVDVVDIDPVILSLGYTVHPHRPYADRRVRAINDDARSFLRRTNEKYDLIVMNALDSHHQLAGLSTLRLESYMYTVEAFRDVRRLMTPDSFLVVQLSSTREWMGHRLHASLSAAFERAPELYYPKNNLYNSIAFVYGPPSSSIDAHASRPPRLAPEAVRAITEGASRTPRATDDWPHLYLSERTIPRMYIYALVLLIGLSAAILLSLARPVGVAASGHFLLLGAGFMLLETRSITKLALVFGSTWAVNAIVIGWVLLCIGVANATVAGGRRISSRLAWSALFGCLVLGYLLPINVLHGWPYAFRLVGAGLWVGLPIFFASILFSQSFRDAPNRSGAFGINLLGVVIGGAMEYLSMIHGLDALYILSIFTYLGALICASLWKRPVPA